MNKPKTALKLQIRNSLCIIALIAIDLGSKLWVIAQFSTQSAPKSDDYQFIKLIFNPGVAFSSFAGGNLFPYISLGINLIVGIACLIYSIFKRSTGLLGWGLVFLTGGAFGNAFDRIIAVLQARPPYVTDFINYGIFIGNFADICVCGGVILIAMFLILRSWVIPSRRYEEPKATRQSIAHTSLDCHGLKPSQRQSRF